MLALIMIIQVIWVDVTRSGSPAYFRAAAIFLGYNKLMEWKERDFKRTSWEVVFLESAKASEVLCCSCAEEGRRSIEPGMSWRRLSNEVGIPSVQTPEARRQGIRVDIYG